MVVRGVRWLERLPVITRGYGVDHGKGTLIGVVPIGHPRAVRMSPLLRHDRTGGGGRGGGGGGDGEELLSIGC